MYQIIASDLDGTLLLPDHTLSLLAKKTLKQLTDLGRYFVFATGRNYADVAQMRDKLGIKAYMITSNGARVHNYRGELVLCRNIDQAVARDLFSLAFGAKGVISNIYRDNQWYIDRESCEEQDFFRESVFHYQLYRPETMPPDNISKIFFTSANSILLQQLQERIVGSWGDSVDVCFSLPSCLEVMAAGVSKGAALEMVAQQLGSSLQASIAFGDGMNDVEMLQRVGKGCIMGNGLPRLKQTLPGLEVIGSNAEDAVTHYLRKLYRLSVS